MNIRVLINGANGKMGQLAVKAISGNPEFSLVATTGRQNNLGEEIKKSQAQVVVDLTTAEAVLKKQSNDYRCWCTSGHWDQWIKKRGC